MRRWLVAIAASLAAAAMPLVTPAAVPVIATGHDRSCAVSRGGAALCWGDNAAGALGNGRSLIVPSPITISGLPAAVASVASSSSAYHTCAVTATRQAYCWGNNGTGQLGNGTVAPSTIPAPVSDLSAGVRQVAVGAYHTCALTTAGGVLCWGHNFLGQLGDGNQPYEEDVPVAVVGLSSGVVAIAAGIEHTCAVTTGGQVKCWGGNENGQLGNGSTQASPLPATVSGLTGVVAITAGFYHTCALTSAGVASCWGSNQSGQLGNGGGANASLPTTIATLSGVIAIAAGGDHTCAVTNGGAASCWGWNGYGQLGTGTTTDAQVPTPVVGLASGTRYLTLGYSHSCAVMTAGDMRCWGNNAYGQLGTGATDTHSTPVAVSGISQVVSAAAGNSHTCAATTAGALLCWGSNGVFQLGNGEAIGSPTPSRIASLSSGTTSITVGDVHACALTQAGDVFCWGSGDLGQLGNGTLSFSTSTPVRANVASVRAIAAGQDFVCAVTIAGSALCWGSNSDGELGDGTTVGRSVPTPVIGLSSGVTAIGAGSVHACALTASGSVYCWGSNSFGQLGDGTLHDRHTSAPAFVSSATAISLGGWHTCVIVSSGDVFCWGYNGQGQLGDGTTTDRASPTKVVGLPSAALAVSASAYHTCALMASGDVYCWGFNGFGELGDGTTHDSARPVKVASLPSKISAIAVGWYHTCAVTDVGDALCWGYNSVGSLGDGSFAQRAKCVVVAREGGGGSIATNDWFLDLDPGVPKTIPPDKIPAFLAKASGNAGTAIVDVKADVQFRPQDVGNPIYVFGYVPASLLKSQGDAKDAAQCVLAQLSPSGQLQAVSASGLQPLVTTVTTTQGQAINVINGTSATSVAGSTFCVGTASSSAQAVNSSNSRCVATVPPAASTTPVCLPPDANTPAALSGLWWNSSESGWGIHFTQRGANVFAAWYTYDTSGNPKWYVSTCAMNGGATGTTGSCSGALFEVTGPTFFNPPFDTSLVHAVNAGSLQVSFQNADNASMTYSGVGGQARTVAITRQPLASGATSGVNYTDIWWGGPSQSGWGLAITQQANTAFLAWYVYDGGGKPMWYVATCTLSGTTCAGDLLRTTGPAFGATFSTSQVQSFPAGTVSVTFTDGNNATLSYTVNGVSGSKAITRQLF